MIQAILNKLFWGFLRHFMTDRQYAKTRYWLSTGEILNLDRPETFSEKINWLKLYDRSDLRKLVADRVKVRDFVSGRIGEEYLIPLLGVYNELNRDVWDSLPRQFVLKANHGSGMIRIVSNKDEENFEEVSMLTKKWQKTDYAAFGREWVYRGLRRTIIAEKLMLTEDKAVPEDYKFFCYHGKAMILQIDIGRYDEHRRMLYDRNLKPLEMELLYDKPANEPEIPLLIKEAFEVADKLSEGFNFVRVDLYLLEDKILFGEMTNFPGNGFEPFTPAHYDRYFGSLLHLHT